MCLKRESNHPEAHEVSEEKHQGLYSLYGKKYLYWLFLGCPALN